MSIAEPVPALFGDGTALIGADPGCRGGKKPMPLVGE